MFIEGLLSSLRSLVLEVREDRPRSNLLYIVVQMRFLGDAMRAQMYVRAPEKKHVTFLSKKSGRDPVSYADGDEYFLEGDKPHAGEGVVLIGESSYTSEFPALPSNTSQQTQDSLFYARNQSCDVLSPRKPVGPQTLFQ